ncbi:OB-fold domain-containing protein [Pseudonocardia sp. NPDC049635]|uniref:Zn-ribbon domain-containing OB-fold protein n=1 Tax=Pseudonocardia sp. NPDC049635 TaxID=3155506 RepID=UPI0033F91F5E
MTVTAIPDLAESGDVVETDAGLRQAGSRCPECRAMASPPVPRCVECAAPTRRVPLADRGTLYAFTTVRVSSSAQTPYTIGYVDLDDGVRVLTGVADPETATVDCRVIVEVAADGSRLARPLTGEDADQ